MNTLINYFESPTKSVNLSVNKDDSKDPEVALISNDKSESVKCNINLCSKSIKTKNQEIVKNMEEVLSLVKKKHKNKHKHDKHESGKRSKHHKHHKNKSADLSDGRSSQKSPLKENRTNSSKKVKKCAKSSVRTLPDLLSPSKRLIHVSEEIKIVNNVGEKLIFTETEKVEVCVPDENLKCTLDSDKSYVEENKSTEQKKKVNAFEFLMNARNKSIGGNSPGKEENDGNDQTDNKKEVNRKRKLMLEDWADRKGAKKRKFEDAAREQYIEDQMGKRATRLKELIEGQNNDKDKKKASSKLKNKVQSDKKEVKKAKALQKSENAQKLEIKVQEKERVVRRSVRNTGKLSNVDSIKDEDMVVLDDVSTDKIKIESPKNYFVTNLSSPIKKRDNLYGYFEKSTPSPKEDKSLKCKTLEALEEIINNESVNSSDHSNIVPIKGKRKKKIKDSEENSRKNVVQNIKDENLDLTPVSNGRPRRSCVGKTRYDFTDFDLGMSPEKNKLNRSKTKSVACKPADTENIIVLDCTNESINEEGNVEQPKKLAPLFLKTVSKPNIDHEKVKARHDFLMSGIPEKMKIEIAKIKQFEQIYETCDHLFPKFNHVPNWILDNTVELKDWKECNVTWNNKSKDCTDYFNPKFNKNDVNENSNLKSILAVEKSSSSLAPLLQLKLLENKRFLIKEWKNIYDKFPTFKCYNQLREKYRYFSAMDTAVDTHQVSESFVVSTRRTIDLELPKDGFLDNVEPPLSAPNGELLFCDKYKPLVSEQILVNTAPVNQLKDFLSNWQLKNRQGRFDESFDSSFEYGNDSNSSSGLPNSIVLVGPSSSGKTNAVFALANELNFNVLEINAGMKRSGKKLLQDLHEATQSHQIRKSSKHSNTLIKKSLTVSRKKDYCVNEDILSTDVEKNTKMSLILVEDADILFDNFDQGFVEAIYQLVGTSKRPVVIIANNKKCSHLQRLINQNCIDFTQAQPVNISKFLTILSLMENCPIHLDDVLSLYYYNNLDLRKTILEMQFFIQSGGDRLIQEEITQSNLKSSPKAYFASPKKNNNIEANDENIGIKQEDDLKEDIQVIDKSIRINEESNKFYIHKQLFEYYTVSQNFGLNIPFPVNFDLLWININEIFQASGIVKSKDSFDNSSDACIKNKEMNTESIMKNLVNFYNNLSLASNINHYDDEWCLVNSIEKEISYYLVEESVTTLMKIDELSYNLFDDKPKIVENISSFIPLTCTPRSKKSMALDYEPMLRSICRSEKTKSNQRRSNSRYYHYLKNFLPNTNSFSLQSFDDVCPIFVDDPTNFIELKQLECKNMDWLD